MFVAPLIERKRDGKALEPHEWTALIRAYASGRVPDYQMAALLMAVYFRGLTDKELGTLTDAMCQSGARLQFGDATPPRIDKHSTGGVGDKVSLVLAPLVASVGIAVPMMSGRGLGHTGGTVDKLEAIPGFRTDLPLAQAKRQVERIGIAMIAQTEEIAPADRRLYALRDATGTVESIPLIAASIMSKKLAEGLSGLVLDVKTGSGAFLAETSRAVELAETMIRLGEERGCPTVALITAMDRPLGVACGAALEMIEAIAALRGAGPEDLVEVTVALGVEMLLLAEPTTERGAARRVLERALASGAALEKFRAVIEAQGGNPAVLDDTTQLPSAAITEVVEADRSGYVARVQPRPVGRLVTQLGGGRATMDDAIDPAVGLSILVKPGQRVERDQPLAVIHARSAPDGTMAREFLKAAIPIVDEEPTAALPLMLSRVTRDGASALP